MPLLQCAEAKQNERAKRARMSDSVIKKSNFREYEERKVKDLYPGIVRRIKYFVHLPKSSGVLFRNR